MKIPTTSEQASPPAPTHADRILQTIADLLQTLDVVLRQVECDQIGQPGRYCPQPVPACAHFRQHGGAYEGGGQGAQIIAGHVQVGQTLQVRDGCGQVRYLIAVQVYRPQACQVSWELKPDNITGSLLGWTSGMTLDCRERTWVQTRSSSNKQLNFSACYVCSTQDKAVSRPEWDFKRSLVSPVAQIGNQRQRRGGSPLSWRDRK